MRVSCRASLRMENGKEHLFPDTSYRLLLSLCDKIPNQDKLKKEGFILAHTVRGPSTSITVGKSKQQGLEAAGHITSTSGSRKSKLSPLHRLDRCSWNDAPTFRIAFPMLVNLIKKLPHRHTQNYFLNDSGFLSG